MRRHKVTFNLTPLLDVILLMVFAYQIQALQRVEASEDLKKQADSDLDSLLAQNQELRETRAELEELLDEARAEAEARREPSVLAETLNHLTEIDRDAVERALREASEEDRQELRKLMTRMEGRPPQEVVRELAKLESYSKYISSWFLYLEEDRAHGEGVSLLRAVVDGREPLVRSMGGSPAELENTLQKLLRDELGGGLDKSQRLVVLRVIARCDLYKANKDSFLTILDGVFRRLKADQRLEGTEFIFSGQETECRSKP